MVAVSFGMVGILQVLMLLLLVVVVTTVSNITSVRFVPTIPFLLYMFPLQTHGQALQQTSYFFVQQQKHHPILEEEEVPRKKRNVQFPQFPHQQQDQQLPQPQQPKRNHYLFLRIVDILTEIHCLPQLIRSRMGVSLEETYRKKYRIVTFEQSYSQSEEKEIRSSPNDNDHQSVSKDNNPRDSFHNNPRDSFHKSRSSDIIRDNNKNEVNSWNRVLQGMSNVMSTLSDATTTTATTTTTSNSITMKAAGCVATEGELRSAIQDAPVSNNSMTSRPGTKITICNTVKISSTITPGRNVTGFDVSFKSLNFLCALPSGSGRCVLDGQKVARIFHGTESKIVAQRLDFINSAAAVLSDYLKGKGSALALFDSSFLCTRCSFLNNTNNDNAGVVYLSNSTVSLVGTSPNPVIFSNNQVSTAGVVTIEKESIFNAISGFIFFTNNKSTGYGTIVTDSSQLNLKGVTFERNKGAHASALHAVSSRVFLEDVVFINNTSSGPTGATKFGIQTRAELLRVIFLRNSAKFSGGALSAVSARVRLDQVTFQWNKVSDNRGADIFIENSPSVIRGGSFVHCFNNVTFCGGLDRPRLYDEGKKWNTNCRRKGIRQICT